jgi:hypothetical protein
MLGELNENRAKAGATVGASAVPLPPPQAQVNNAQVPAASTLNPQNIQQTPTQKSNLSFEAGKVFAQFDRGDGKIDKQAFESILLQHPDLLGKHDKDSSGYIPKDWVAAAFDGPSRSLTHYDETAGVAIPLSAVAAHQAMGNSVVPLVESYSGRYSRLRTMMTAKLLPKREQLMQFRRQLNHTSTEVEATRVGIERETISDTQQILDRLKTVESLRQSAIKHQVILYLQLAFVS